MSYEKATLTSYLRKIHEKELVLPAIQRDFVWDEDHIYSLLDSIFRGYPFGTLLFWNTKQRVQFREFTLASTEDERYTYDIKEAGKKSTLVLDGQQRLQSLYVAIYGTLENKRLYFDLLSGDEPEDISQAKYIFLFLDAERAEMENKENIGKLLWIPLREIAMIETYGKMIARVQQYLKKLNLSAESLDGMRLSDNVSIAYASLKSDQVLNFYTVDKEYGDDGLTTSQDEVLEIFVRVDREFIVVASLSALFSLMQLSWEGAADAISELVDKLNKKGRFNFDKDFVLKCSLVCVGKGAKYEVAKFRKDSTIKEIESEFPRLDRALDNFVNFLVATCKLLDDRIFRSYNSLIPFVYYFYLQSGQDIQGEEERMQLNQALYLSLMTTVYSRFADNYIDQVVNNILILAHESQPGVFPMEQYRRFIYEKREKYSIDDPLLQNNIPLLMNILEKGRILPEGRRSRRPEYDHIFPKGKLPDYGYSEESINHYANMRLISAKDNNWKRAQDPKPYFEEWPNVMDYYLIPSGLLEYKQYPEFIKTRREMILERVRTFLGISKEVESFDSSSPPPQKDIFQPIEERLDSEEGEFDEIALIMRVLTRAPISEGQLTLYQLLYTAGDNGMTAAELQEQLNISGPQFGGLTGALGRRINGTQGVAQSRLHFFIHSVYWVNIKKELHYWLRPVFRKILEDGQFISEAKD